MSSLDDLKKIVDKHLRRELDIFEKILELGEDDLIIFLRWYLNNPYVKGIEEVLSIVRGRADKKTQGHSH